jgi:hypothetical protein
MFAAKKLSNLSLVRAMSTGKFVGGRPLRLQDKVAVITGAAGGIGRVSSGSNTTHSRWTL